MSSMRLKQRCLSKIKVALIVTSLLPLLTSCASPPMVTQIQVELQRVPEALLVPCPVPVLEGSTYQAAIELALALRGALGECNLRLEDLRRWSQQ